MTDHASRNWEDFHVQRAAAAYPRWPLEAMVKVVFGGYLRNRIELPAEAHVLDVGCGFGNNLLPFLERGHRCYGVEITAAIAELSQRLLRERGQEATIVMGSNRELPFGNAEFDLLLSLNVLHYEKDEEAIRAALAEYARVLKPGAPLVLFTVGPHHDIYRKAQALGGHRYRIRNFDFRDGEEYFYFDNLKYLALYLSPLFDGLELGRVTEQLFTMELDFLIAVGRRRSHS